MTRFGWLAAYATAVVGGLVACTFTTDLDPLKNGACPAGKKACDDVCVATDSPRNGCALNTCSPCTLPNAVARCGPVGQCVIASCGAGSDDCDHNPSNGCEQDIGFNAANCGACARSCSVPNAIPGCTNGVCVVGSCNSDFVDCDKRSENGCECPASLGCATATPPHCRTLDAGAD